MTNIDTEKADCELVNLIRELKDPQASQVADAVSMRLKILRLRLALLQSSIAVGNNTQVKQ